MIRLSVQTGGLEACIGGTPLVYIASLSAATGCHIYAKAEFLNPGGSIKDRVALQIIKDAEAAGKLHPGSTVTEGTAGSTGIALAMVCAARGYRCHIFMPDDMATEKAEEICALGAQVTRVRPVSISHPGTGGTIAGVSHALKAARAATRVVLVDPPGSSLYHKVKRGVLFTRHESEGTRLRNPFDTVTEGVGLNRLTRNFQLAAIDDAVACSDQEAVDMAHFLLRREGLWVGSSSAVNCVGAVRVARQLGRGHTIVTILCDGGRRHLSKFYDAAFLRKHGLEVRAPSDDLAWISQ